MSGGEIFLIMLFVLIFFGADKIPEIARGLGKGLREFKKAADEIKSEITSSTIDVREEMSEIRAEVSSSAVEVKQSFTESTSVSSHADVNTTQDNSYQVYPELKNEGDASAKSQPEVAHTNKPDDKGNVDFGANI